MTPSAKREVTLPPVKREALLPSKRRWTETDEGVLKALYLKEGLPTIARTLRRSVSAVRARAVKLGLIAKTKPLGRRRGRGSDASAARVGGRKRGRGSGIKTEIDGHVFDSKIEAKHYQELKLREKAGEIRNLRLQVRYPLHAAKEIDNVDNRTQIEKVGVYIADFVYEEKQTYIDLGAETSGWVEVVTDVKPNRQRRKRDNRLMPDRATPVFKLKEKLFNANYAPQKIRIVRL